MLLFFFPEVLRCCSLSSFGHFPIRCPTWAFPPETHSSRRVAHEYRSFRVTHSPVTNIVLLFNKAFLAPPSGTVAPPSFSCFGFWCPPCRRGSAGLLEVLQLVSVFSVMLHRLGPSFLWGVPVPVRRRRARYCFLCAGFSPSPLREICFSYNDSLLAGAKFFLPFLVCQGSMRLGLNFARRFVVAVVSLEQALFNG